MQNLLLIGKILRTHGIKGAVKIESFLDGVNFSIFKTVFIGQKKEKAKLMSASSLNNDFYLATFDIMPNIDMAEKYKNAEIFIDRSSYAEFKDKVYLSDLVGTDIVNENGEKVATLVSYENYGASDILTVREGAVSYQIPFVEDVIYFDQTRQVFVVNQQKYEDLRV